MPSTLESSTNQNTPATGALAELLDLDFGPTVQQNDRQFILEQQQGSTTASVTGTFTIYSKFQLFVYIFGTFCSYLFFNKLIT